MRALQMKMAGRKVADDALVAMNLSLARMGLLKLEGRSLSFCIQDIMYNRIDLHWVSKIVAGTNAPDSAAWARLLEKYSTFYWQDYPSRGRALANYFRNAGLIEQPRTEGEMAHNIADGHWVGLFGKPFRLPW